MADHVGAAVGRAFNGSIKGAFKGAVGSFFAPVAAAAAGGTLATMGACAVAGGSIAFAASPIIDYTFKSAESAANDPNSPPGLAGALCALGLLEMGVAIYLGCQLGAAVLGVAAAPVLSCYLTGMVACAVLTLVIAAIFVSAAVAAGINLDETVHQSSWHSL